MRLAHIPGEWIDRNRPVEFSFDGQPRKGFAGDCLSSALWSAGVRALAFSRHYQRPRGILSLAGDDANFSVRFGDHANLSGDTTEIETGRAYALSGSDRLTGLRARWWGTLADWLPSGWASRRAPAPAPALLPPGDVSGGPVAAPPSVVSARPAMGTPSAASDPRRVASAAEQCCEVLVIGAGPAGLAAALAAAESGAEVMLVDECLRPGGSGLYQLGGDPARRAITRSLIDQVTTHPGILCLAGHLASACEPGLRVMLRARDAVRSVQARALIVATGAYEQPAIFRNNDLPGVMLASAAQRLIYRYAVRPAERMVLLLANDDGYRCAFDLLLAGVTLAAVIDLRPRGKLLPLQALLRDRKIEILHACCVYEAHSGHDGCLSGVTCCPISQAGQIEHGRQRFISCDGLCMSVGWTPAAELLCQAGGTFEYRSAIEQFIPAAMPPGVFAAGRVNGVYTLDSKIEDGSRAGHDAAAFLGQAPQTRRAPVLERSAPNHAWAVVPHPAGMTFVDWDQEVLYEDLLAAIEDGCDTIESLQRRTGCGLGRSGGRYSMTLLVRVLARALGESPARVGMCSSVAAPPPPPAPQALEASRGRH